MLLSFNRCSISALTAPIYQSVEETLSAETQSGLPFVLHLRQKSNLFVFSFFLVYNNL